MQTLRLNQMMEFSDIKRLEHTSSQFDLSESCCDNSLDFFEWSKSFEPPFPQTCSFSIIGFVESPFLLVTKILPELLYLHL